MSKNSFVAKIEFVLKMINNIEILIQRHKTITAVLQDEIEAKPALLMALMQIGETFNKIDDSLLVKYHLQVESKGSYSVRNFIAHDYEGVDLGLVESVVRLHLPELKNKLIKILDDTDKT